MITEKQERNRKGIIRLAKSKCEEELIVGDQITENRKNMTMRMKRI